MTIPNIPPDTDEYPDKPDIREPDPDLPPGGLDPEVQPLDAPGASPDDAPMRMPADNPDAETEL